MFFKNDGWKLFIIVVYSVEFNSIVVELVLGMFIPRYRYIKSSGTVGHFIDRYAFYM